MTLTEEQRAAIHAVSGLLTAIGCPQCHSYLQKNYTHHIEVLRAMTDSSEHFTGDSKLIGFDLEGARDAVQMCNINKAVWAHGRAKHLPGAIDLIELQTTEIERLRGFETAARDLSNDLTRVAKERDELQEANTNFAFQASDQAQEIERLRAEISEQKGMIWKTRQVKKEQYAQIKDLKADLEQSERVIEARLDVIDQQAAQIKELEADNQNLVTLNKSLMNNDWILRDNNRKYRKRAQKAELLNKELKSKIGPDARPPCWQITEERKAALAAMSNLSETISCPDCGVWIGFADIGPHMAVLRGMLEESQ